MGKKYIVGEICLPFFEKENNILCILKVTKYLLLFPKNKYLYEKNEIPTTYFLVVCSLCSQNLIGTTHIKIPGKSHVDLLFPIYVFYDFLAIFKWHFELHSDR